MRKLCKSEVDSIQKVQTEIRAFRDCTWLQKMLIWKLLSLSEAFARSFHFTRTIMHSNSSIVFLDQHAEISAETFALNFTSNPNPIAHDLNLNSEAS